MNRIKIAIIAFLLLSIWENGAYAKKQEIHSPNKQIVVTVDVIGNRLTYSVVGNGHQLLMPSPLGLVIDSVDLGLNVLTLSGPEAREINESHSIFGSHSLAYNHANEAKIQIEASGFRFYLFVRVYDDGVAVRYSIPDGARRIDFETTSWNIPQHVGKISWSDFHQSYEGLSHVTPFDEVPQNEPIMGPLTIQIGEYFLSLSEADNESFSDMAFCRDGQLFKACFPFAKLGWDIEYRIDNSPTVLNGAYSGYKVSPWRTMIIAKNLTELVNSDLLTNLCPASAPGSDFSWVKPGRCLWQWWSIGAPTYEDQHNWYDAAAKLKWEYYLVDDGWRYWNQPGKDEWILLKEAIDYGKSVGVKSIVWVDSKEFRKADERRAYLEKVKAVGADGIKIDFIPDATPQIMQWYMGTMQDCADLGLLLNFHGSVKPTGLSRTYPNDITREAVRGNEYHMTRYKRVAQLDQDVSLPFTRLMAGAADITPVILDPEQLVTQKFTWAHEFAQAIVYLSPVTHFTDQYKFYIQSPMFDLFQELPTVWDETKVLSCTEMGEIVAFARRKDSVWWIGVMNGATEREVEIPLDFLKKEIDATLVYDNVNLNTSIDRREQRVSPKDVLVIKLASGGGFVARF